MSLLASPRWRPGPEFLWPPTTISYFEPSKQAISAAIQRMVVLRPHGLSSSLTRARGQRQLKVRRAIAVASSAGLKRRYFTQAGSEASTPRILSNTLSTPPGRQRCFQQALVGMQSVVVDSPVVAVGAKQNFPGVPSRNTRQIPLLTGLPQEYCSHRGIARFAALQELRAELGEQFLDIKHALHRGACSASVESQWSKALLGEAATLICEPSLPRASRQELPRRSACHVLP